MDLNGFHKKNFSRIFISLIAVILSLYVALSAFTYNKFIFSYNEALNASDYAEAASVEKSKASFNIFKKLLFNKDKLRIINSCINNLNKEFIDKNITEKSFASALENLKALGAQSDKIEKIKAGLPEAKTSKDLYDKALVNINKGSYEEALKLLKEIPSYSPIYDKALEENKKALGGFKSILLKSSAEYASKEYYSKAISTLEAINKYTDQDKEIQEKIKEYKDKRSDYISKSSSSSSVSGKSILSFDDISKDIKENSHIESYINTLGLSSSSPYLAWVSTASQITYIFKGSKDSWRLIDKFPCSTGKPGHDTPKGLFITNGDKDLWFFNPKFNDGAKFWVRINGDYLFHSIPFDKTQKNITDSLLGEPRSHGCIRLSLENSKWIYDNLQKGSTVVIR
ncbi:L,D-transpeptidase [Clostridium polynesiense]|uniref:L,D-transpeptidase n=1 Tax=Clostridium polynesiense TaxID=1325933 RepID=UPI000694CA07|nr:L,D-transpeptidase family protein [Clostridium polynesiense]